MKGFSDNEQIGFRKMIRHDAWINTGLLTVVLLSAYLQQDQEQGYMNALALFVVWSLYRMQRRELDSNIRFLFFGFSVVQNFIMIVALFNVGRALVQMWRFFGM